MECIKMKLVKKKKTYPGFNLHLNDSGRKLNNMLMVTIPAS